MILEMDRIGAVVTAYTGFLCGDWTAFVEYAERILGRKLSADDFQLVYTWSELHSASYLDFLDLSSHCERRKHAKN